MPVRLTSLTRLHFTISPAKAIRVIGHAAFPTLTTRANAGILCGGISPENKKGAVGTIIMYIRVSSIITWKIRLSHNKAFGMAFFEP
jgi:hypothetical protein